MLGDYSLQLLPRHLRLICAIAEWGQLGIAARRLSLTQPAASRMLGDIERMIGVALFERHPKGMKLTPMGEVMARRAASIVHGLNETGREIDSFKAGRSGAVRIGAVTGGAVGFVVPAIRELKRATRDAEIHVDVGPSDTLIDGLLSGNFDFVLGRVPPGIDARQFDILRGRVELVSFLVRAGHPLADASNLGLSDLADFEWIIQAKGTPMRQAVEEAFIAAEVAIPSGLINSTSLLVTIAFLATSDIIAPVTLEVTQLLGKGLIDAKVVPLDMRDSIVITPYHLIARKDHAISPVAARLRELVLTVLSERDREEFHGTENARGRMARPPQYRQEE